MDMDTDSNNLGEQDFDIKELNLNNKEAIRETKRREEVNKSNKKTDDIFDALIGEQADEELKYTVVDRGPKLQPIEIVSKPGDKTKGFVEQYEKEYMKRENRSKFFLSLLIMGVTVLLLASIWYSVGI